MALHVKSWDDGWAQYSRSKRDRPYKFQWPFVCSGYKSQSACLQLPAHFQCYKACFCTVGVDSGPNYFSTPATRASPSSQILIATCRQIRQHTFIMIGSMTLQLGLPHRYCCLPTWTGTRHSSVWFISVRSVFMWMICKCWPVLTSILIALAMVVKCKGSIGAVASPLNVFVETTERIRRLRSVAKR